MIDDGHTSLAMRDMRDAGELPDLPTTVALAGTVHRAEVGGNVCFNTIITVAIVTGGG